VAYLGSRNIGGALSPRDVKKKSRFRCNNSLAGANQSAMAIMSMEMQLIYRAANISRLDDSESSDNLSFS
jgi:hypothetical protein